MCDCDASPVSDIFIDFFELFPRIRGKPARRSFTQRSTGFKESNGPYSIEPRERSHPNEPMSDFFYFLFFLFFFQPTEIVGRYLCYRCFAAPFDCPLIGDFLRRRRATECLSAGALITGERESVPKLPIPKTPRFDEVFGSGGDRS